MRILIVGATGTIGKAIVAALRDRHDLVLASHHTAPEKVDIADAESIRALYKRVGRVDAVVSAAGQAAFKPLEALADGDFAFSVANKLMGQVNLVRLGRDAVADGGSFTLTSGILAQHPIPGSAAISIVNSGVEAFARAASLELPRGLRVNVVSPPSVSETLVGMGRDPASGLSASEIARSYVESIEGKQAGQVIAPKVRAAAR